MIEFGLPSLGVNSSLAPFAAIAIIMLGVTIFVLGKILPVGGRPPLVTQVMLALMVLVSGSVLLLSLLFVFLNPDGPSAWTWVLLAFNFMMMGPTGIWFIGLIAFRDRRIDATAWTWPIGIALVTTGSEVIMGVLFAIGGETGSLPVVTIFALGLTSVWFFWSMAAVMFALVLWAPLARVERSALFALAISAALGPWVTAYPTVGGLAMGALMTIVFLLLVRQLSVRGSVGPGQVGLLFGLAIAFLATAISGFYVVAAGGTPVAGLTFGAIMGVVMTVEIAYLFRRFYGRRSGIPWVSRPADDEEPAGARPGPSVDRSSADPGAGRGTPLPPSALNR